jgi:cytochrome c-type biogenesis protein CcmH/NrfG
VSGTIEAGEQTNKSVEVRAVTGKSWNVVQAYTLAAVCLVLGICGGATLRRMTEKAGPAITPSVAAAPEAPTSQAMPTSLNPLAMQPNAEDIRKAADTQAAPLLEQLKTDPTNATILAQLGNIYYDAKQYSAAIEYYHRSLKTQPKNTSVGTDLGTAYWYGGDADSAIKQFNQVLSIAPTNANTLFNLGIVEWQGKKDKQAALAAWQKLLETNPGYENKQQVESLIVQAKN